MKLLFLKFRLRSGLSLKSMPHLVVGVVRHREVLPGPVERDPRGQRDEMLRVAIPAIDDGRLPIGLGDDRDRVVAAAGHPELTVGPGRNASAVGSSKSSPATTVSIAGSDESPHPAAAPANPMIESSVPASRVAPDSDTSAIRLLGGCPRLRPHRPDDG